MEKIFELLNKSKYIILGGGILLTLVLCSLWVKNTSTKLNVAKQELEQKKELIKQKEEKLEDVVKLEEEYSRYVSDYQSMKQKQEEMLLPVKSYEKQDIISFFSNWAKISRLTDVKIQSIRPVVSEGSAVSGNVEITLEGKYPDLYDFFSGVARVGSLPKSTRFDIVHSEKGYPILKVDIMLGL